MCGDRAWYPHSPKTELRCANTKCNTWGYTLVPYSETSNYLTVTTEAYTNSISSVLSQYGKKEQDMCKETTRWSLLIGDKGNGTYSVEFSHREKELSDNLTRTFETFDEALEFANKKYKELK